MKKLKLITILGPTASGKSELGIYLAKEYGSSIISGDAFQV
ncbi:isopentenyl transferase family protein, partial [Dialister micraerophilus]